MEKKTIKFMKPLRAGKESIESITLRAPNFADFLEFGEPEFWVPVATGEGRGGFIQTNLQAVRQYIERLSPADLNLALLEAACLEDTMRLRDAVLSFFRDAMKRVAEANTPGQPTPAPSGSTTENPSSA